MKHIPNIITSLNLVSGFIAIIFAAGGELLIASWIIMAAMIFDFLDGFSARLLKAYSDLGKELDSLADVISFGVAPAIIIFHLLSNSLSSSVPVSGNAIDTKTIFVLLIPGLMPVCAALRLAIFNLDSSQKTTFRGLPTPANAIAVITMIIATSYSDSTILIYLMRSPLMLTMFTIALSLLMVSRIPLISLKITNFGLKGNEGRYLLAGIILITFIIFGISSLPFIIPYYIITSLLQSMIFDSRSKNSK